MGGQASRGPTVTRLCWWLVDVVSRLLEPDERDAVRGDFAESGETGGHALRDALGLVVRRQAALCRDWRTWLACIAFVFPVGLLLALSASWLGRSYDLYLWVFQNYRDIDATIAAETGLTVRTGIMLLVSRSLLLACWSWTSGVVLGSLSRRAIVVNGGLLCFAVMLGGFPNWYTGAPSLSLTFYSVSVPVLRLAVLVLLPLLWGMRQGVGLATRPFVQTIVWAAASVTAVAPGSFWLPFRDSWHMRLLLVEVYVLVGCMVATASWRRWRGRNASA
jgi:hypothetical protein